MQRGYRIAWFHRTSPGPPMALGVAIVALFVLIPGAAYPQGDPADLRMGTNLAGPSDHGAEWPLVNVMKYARTWITHNAFWVEGGENAWDTGYLAQIPCDAQGYPLELPVAVAGAETTQVVRTVWANTAKLLAGTYVVLWDGTGQLDVWGDATLVTQEPGRLTFDLAPQPDGLFALEILQSRSGDHVRNLRVLLPGTESTYQDEPWCLEWLVKLEPFTALRFMDWGHTNDSSLAHWSDRAEIGDYTYTRTGMPYELMVELCNRLDADPWVCVPHRADDAYIRAMARLFRDGLEPDLRVHVEYSNEIWNWMFDQAHYCHDNGDQGVPWPERIAPFVQNALDLWTEEFAGQTDRLLRVVGVQASWQDVSNRIVAAVDSASYDAFAPAAYFHFAGAGHAALAALGGAATADTVIALARDGMLQEAWPSLVSQKTHLADALDIPMLYYEGGQHLTPDPFGSDQPYGPALVAAQTHPGMYDLYTAWLDSLVALADPARPSLFMNFSYITGASARYGTWGVLQHQWDEQPPYLDVAPKYQAVLDFVAGQHTGVDDPDDPDDPFDPDAPDLLPAATRLAQNHPNPFNPATTIAFDLARPADVDLSVFDLRGRRVARLLHGPRSAGRHALVWRARELPAGVYLYRLTTGAHVLTRRAVLVR